MRSFSSTARVVSKTKMKIVMDLDECMIHSFDTGTPGDCLDIFPGLEIIDFLCEDKYASAIRSYLRPGLRDYLQKVSVFADLYVYTAALDQPFLP
jgi:hypothetical protein